MIRKSFYGKSLIAIALLSFLAIPALAAAETVTFDPETVAADADKLEEGPLYLEGADGAPISDYLAPAGSDTGKSTSLTGNAITVESGTVGAVLGGINKTDTDVVDNNTVTINGGTIGNGGVVLGGRSQNANVTNNDVVITGGTVNGEVIGGWSSGNTDLTVTGNTVTIEGGSVTGPIYGGYIWTSGDATMSGNTVDISDDAVVDAGGSEIFGGYAVGGSAKTISASGNSLTITGDASVSNARLIIGGYADAYKVGATPGWDHATAGTADNNTVSVDTTGVSGSIGSIYGGASSGGASTNTVTVTGEGSVGTVYGAASLGSGTVTSSTVTINEATVGTVIGASTGDGGSVTNNNITVGSGAKITNMYGGFVGEEIAALDTGNTLTKNDEDSSIGTAAGLGTVTFDYAGKANIGRLDTGEDATKTFTLAGGTNAIDFDGTLSGDAAIDSTGTGELTLSGANTFTNNISTDGDLTVTGTLGAGEYDGDITVGNPAGALTLNQTANQTLTGAINANSLTKEGDSTLTLSNASNTIATTAIDGGTLKLTDADAAGSSAIAAASGATLELALANGTTFDNVLSGDGGLTVNGESGGEVTVADTQLYTGMTTVENGTLKLDTGASLASKDLTLNAGTTFDTNGQAHSLDDGSLTVLGSGATYKGDLQADGATVTFSSQNAVTDTMLTVTGNASLDDATINMNVPGGAETGNGATFSILDVTGALSGTPVLNSGGTSGTVRQGSTIAYDIITSVKNNTLTGTLTNGRALPQAKALSEGFLGGLALTMQGADLAAGQGMRSAARAANAGGSGAGAFGALSGGSLRYDTGSHVDMNSVSMMAGMSFGVDLAPGRLVTGVFFEYGNGSYDTHNSFGNSSANGDGDTYYTGGGILGRMDFQKTGPGHAYVEASARLGNTHNEYGTSDLRDPDTGRAADYDASSLYYGMHLGTGYVFDITDKASLDLYGKYFWTRQEGDSVNLSTGEDLNFKDSDSHRTRLGARAAYQINEYVAPYAGAAWEYEFDGKARATTNGFGIGAPDMKGSTGIGELGLTVTPSKNLPLSFDLGVQGYAGKREGVTGSLQVKFEF